jgi:YD repeat-containing protein
MNDDPTSVLTDPIGWVGNIDLLSDSFEGLGPRAMMDDYRVARNQPSDEPKLLSNYSPVDANRVDGRYPCLLMKRRRNTGARPAAFDVTVDKCLPKSFTDSEVDEIEVDLRSGLITIKKTDLFLPGPYPVAATRCYRSWDLPSRTFGRNATLSWDMYPLGDMHPYTYMDLYLCDGSKIHYERISQGSGSADVLYEHRQTATPFLGSRMRWNGNAWHLKRVDGTGMFFPGTFNARRGVDGAMIEFRGATGESVTVERDGRRNLKRLITPSQQSIKFEYDARNRIVRADDQLRIVKYVYDVVGRLVEVQSPDSTTRFEYDYEDIIAIHENGRRLVEFQYPAGLVERISLADGRIYKIRYEEDSQDKSIILRTHLTAPDGTRTKLDIKPR